VNVKPEVETHSNLEHDIPATAGTGADDSHDPGRESRKSDFGALWLLAGVVALTGSFLWMIRDVWLSKPVATGAPIAETLKDAPTGQGSEIAAESSTRQTLAAPPANEGVLPDERLEVEQLDALQRQAERLRIERLEAEKRLEQEMAARALLEQQRVEEQQRLERERVALERQRAETLKRLELERREREALERKRRDAEDLLAKQKARRAEVERQARLEEEKLERARQTAITAEEERTRAEAQARAAASRDAEAPEPVEVIEAFPEEAAETVSRPEPTATGKSGFSTNPCDGPTAKFLSTCR
jgi:hypothetical protein